MHLNALQTKTIKNLCQKVQQLKLTAPMTANDTHNHISSNTAVTIALSILDVTPPSTIPHSTKSKSSDLPTLNGEDFDDFVQQISTIKKKNALEWFMMLCGTRRQQIMT
ncbi:unnamed protein product [Didymodactylos carnosus]|uniref:Uncharacterized protein n=1 Tax=Didymodactylos carnosus TaxID=1234261 RepID=A0A8S2IMZ5_9BILA|nr:unnamed protein product [Didymodactylos carnosus]CAF3744395.1 unnamed protein product [Didymodactylos carnosus]